MGVDRVQIVWPIPMVCYHPSIVISLYFLDSQDDHTWEINRASWLLALHWRDPYCIEAEFLNIIQLVYDALEAPTTISSQCCITRSGGWVIGSSEAISYHLIDWPTEPLVSGSRMYCPNGSNHQNLPKPHCRRCLHDRSMIEWRMESGTLNRLLELIDKYMLD